MVGGKERFGVEQRPGNRRVSLARVNSAKIKCRGSSNLKHSVKLHRSLLFLEQLSLESIASGFQVAFLHENVYRPAAPANSAAHQTLTSSQSQPVFPCDRELTLQSLLQRCPRQASELQRDQRRRLHTISPLNRECARSDGGYAFLNAQAFKTAWTNYQQWIVDNLNRLTQGTNTSVLPS